jgi:hypothetical protein
MGAESTLTGLTTLTGGMVGVVRVDATRISPWGICATRRLSRRWRVCHSVRADRPDPLVVGAVGISPQGHPATSLRRPAS